MSAIEKLPHACTEGATIECLVAGLYQARPAKLSSHGSWRTDPSKCLSHFKYVEDASNKMCEERHADDTCLILMVVAGAARTKKLLPPFEHSAVLRPVESMLLAKASCSWRRPCMSMACKPFLAATIAWRKAYSTEVESSSEGSPLALLDMTPLGFGESCKKSRCLKPDPNFYASCRNYISLVSGTAK